MTDEWVIEPRSLGVGARLREVWRYRHLFSYFARQTMLDVLRQSPLSWLWLLLRSGTPILLTALVFGEIGRFPSGGVPYLLFLVVGMTAWNLFEFSLLAATRSMNMYARVVTRLYFPRVILPPVSTMEALIRLAILLGLMLFVALYYLLMQGQWYLDSGPRLPIAGATLLLAWLLAVAFGLWTCVLEAPSRDVRYSVRYFLRFWFFLTPVLYPLSAVPERWQWLIALNPLTGVVETFRWSLLGQAELPLTGLGISFITLFVVGVGGLLFFARAESRMLDTL